TGGNRAGPAAKVKSQHRERGGRDRSHHRGNPSANDDDALFVTSAVNRVQREARRREQEHRVMKIPLALHELLYFCPFVRMVVKREVVVPREEEQGCGEKRERPKPQRARRPDAVWALTHSPWCASADFFFDAAVIAANPRPTSSQSNAIPCAVPSRNKNSAGKRYRSTARPTTSVNAR